MPLIEDYNKKKKEGYYDWKEVDNPVTTSKDSTVMIPEHGNHPVFDKGGSVIPPAKNRAKSSGKKYFY